jgi:hypothetical protein
MAEMNGRTRFARDPEVVGKVIDGEAIIINLATGMYYSADEVGGLIWTLLETGHSIGEVATHVTARYHVEADRAHADVERIALQLIEEGLVAQANPQAEASPVVAASPPERRAYVAPSLEVYRDMKDLLALDPPMPALKRNPWERS